MAGAPQITYVTGGPWGSGVGRRLQASEVDNNFNSLAQAIVDLQTNPATPNGISSITVTGTLMYITLTGGQVLGPYTLPVLTFRWRGSWEPNTAYAVLDVFTVDQVGIFMVTIAHVSPAVFDPNQLVNGQSAITQLFGAVDASLTGLSDVNVTNVQNNDALLWSTAVGKWENVNIKTMAFQDASNVAITGGTVKGLPNPTLATDAATKGYVDAAVSGGSNIPNLDLVANISGSTGPASGTTFSAYLDAVFATTVRGTIIYRGGSGWTVLAPGTSGQFLKTLGAGSDPQWAAGSSGVTSISQGTGIALSTNPLIATGTVSLGAINSGSLLANTSGSSAAPVDTTTSALLDSTISSSRGAIAFRGVSNWTALTPGSPGQYLQTGGVGADPQWNSPAGAGTVTSVASGTGLTGGPITSTGTLSLATIADGDFLANTSGSTAAPIPTTLTTYLDHVLSSPAQGSVFYRGSSAYAFLGPGTSGQFLQTGGASANPSWASAPSAPTISDGQILANISGSTATATGHTLSDIFDHDVSSSRATLFFRGASGWTGLAPGTTGQVLVTGTATTDPHWAAASSASLAGLSDVTISSPAAGQLLGYDATASKWENFTLTGTNNTAFSYASGVVTLASNSINPTGTDADLVTWASIEGLRWKYTCTCATAAALPAGTYNNGTSGVGATFTVTATGVLTVDGHTIAQNDIILVKNQASALQNGIYVCTTAGAVGVSAVLTRAAWNNDVAGTTGYTASIAPGDVTAILLGTVNAGSVWMQTNLGSGSGSNIVVGTDSLSYSMIGGTNSGGTLPIAISGLTDKDILVYDNASSTWKNQRKTYIVGADAESTAVLTASQGLLHHRFTKAVTFPANFGSYLGHASQAGGTATATASTVVNIDKASSASPNTFSNVGTITFAAGTVTPTFASSGGTTVSFSQGDVLRMVGPSSADATFAGFYASLVGFET